RIRTAATGLGGGHRGRRIFGYNTCRRPGWYSLIAQKGHGAGDAMTQKDRATASEYGGRPVLLYHECSSRSSASSTRSSFHSTYTKAERGDGGDERATMHCRLLQQMFWYWWARHTTCLGQSVSVGGSIPLRGAREPTCSAGGPSTPGKSER